MIVTTEDFAKIRQLFISTYMVPDDKWEDYLKNIAKKTGFVVDGRTFNPIVAHEIAQRYNRDIFRLMVGSLNNGPDIFKQAGYLTFWIRKLKPFEPGPAQRNSHKPINEIVAYIAGKWMIQATENLEWDGHGNTEKDRRENAVQFARQFIYNLRFGNLSPDVISQIFYCMYRITTKPATPSS